MALMEEGVLEKSGVQLFKELLRVYPIAEPEDYFKGGMWKDEVMKMDLKLIYAHAREAGAPYPPALEKVKLPDMPQQMLNATGGIQLPAGVRPPLGALAQVRPGATPITAPGAVPAAGAAAAAAGPAVELRLIALFVAKWKLDPTKTKVMLAKLTPARRRYVIQTFKGATPGGDSTGALDQHIAQCEKTNAWANATAVVTPTPAATTPPKATALTPVLATGVKRPLTPTITPTNPALDASKRPRLATPLAPKAVTPLRPTMTAPAARPAFVSPAVKPGMMAPRPGMVRAKAPQQGGLIKGLLNKF